MKNNTILNIRIGKQEKKDINISVKMFLSQSPNKFFHIVNLNPDIFVLAYFDHFLKSIINSADCILIDGVGVKIASILHRVPSGERMTGTDLMQELVMLAAKNKKRVMFLGGNNFTAEKTRQFFLSKYPGLQCIAIPGSKKIQKETPSEKKVVLDLIDSFRPHFLFIAYGPPYQEKWIFNNRDKLKGSICMGVGGAFKLISGEVPRAPKIFINLGLEWFWRSLAEPRRILFKLPRSIFFFMLVGKGLIFRHREVKSRK